MPGRHRCFCSTVNRRPLKCARPLCLWSSHREHGPEAELKIAKCREHGPAPRLARAVSRLVRQGLPALKPDDPPCLLCLNRSLDGKQPWKGLVYPESSRSPHHPPPPPAGSPPAQTQSGRQSARHAARAAGLRGVQGPAIQQGFQVPSTTVGEAHWAQGRGHRTPRAARTRRCGCRIKAPPTLQAPPEDLQAQSRCFAGARPLGALTVHESLLGGHGGADDARPQVGQTPARGQPEARLRQAGADTAAAAAAAAAAPGGFTPQVQAWLQAKPHCLVKSSISPVLML